MTSSILTYFKGIAAKRLSEVEILPKKSNQHEFNGTKPFKELLGLEKRVFKTKFIFLNDDESLNITEESQTTWYDAREEHESRTEHRLYYKSNSAISKMTADDLMIFCKINAKEALLVFAPQGSTAEKQLLWLFGLKEVERKLIVKDFSKEHFEVGFARSYILESLGVKIVINEKNYLDLILKKFGKKFPTTEEFSSFARSTTDVSPKDDADYTLVKWMEQEELLFKVLEKYLVEEKLSAGFGKTGLDVDDFIRFSLSVHQRRKSRAGWAFDHHVAEIFHQLGVRYSRQAITEGKSKPDFLFPGYGEYRNKSFPTDLLTMLALKTTAKDRWRQILTEAERIERKHLLTLEPSISLDQTNEMKEKRVQLVVPKEVILTYNYKQQSEIWDLQTFIGYVLNKQKND